MRCKRSCSLTSPSCWRAYRAALIIDSAKSSTLRPAFGYLPTPISSRTRDSKTRSASPGAVRSPENDGPRTSITRRLHNQIKASCWTARAPCLRNAKGVPVYGGSSGCPCHKTCGSNWRRRLRGQGNNGPGSGSAGLRATVNRGSLGGEALEKIRNEHVSLPLARRSRSATADLTSLSRSSRRESPMKSLRANGAGVTALYLIWIRA